MTAKSRQNQFLTLLVTLCLLIAGTPLLHAQQQQVSPRQLREDMLDARWRQLQTEHFTIYSQLSSRRTRSLALELEAWRQAAAAVLGLDGGFPPAIVPNLVYVFDDSEDLQSFTLQDDVAFFTSTPRDNYLAIVDDADDSLQRGLHHYAHFLVRNFIDLRVPRWYEEGAAGYLSRIGINRSNPEIEPYSWEFNYRMATVSEQLAMERMLYNDASLVSPRLVQIANIKSEVLLHYLFHGGEEEGFPDRRGNLQAYLGYLIEGQDHRSAFDLGMGVTPEELDEELQEYLLNSARPDIDLGITPDVVITEEVTEASEEHMALRLAELALNAGEYPVAEEFFRYLVVSDSERARAWSGLGDALRFQEDRASHQEIAGYFASARELAPREVNTLLDFGEYWESELVDCNREFPPAQRSALERDVRQAFEQALELAPNNPEVHLALGQFYLFDGQDWRTGRQHQRRAFELLPADSFIMEQAIRYAISAEEFDEAERLIAELAQPMHFYDMPPWVEALQSRMYSRRAGESYDACNDE